MNSVVELSWVSDDGYTYDKAWANESGISPEELRELGEACRSWYYAEMSDSYAVTLGEQQSIERRIKPILDKYNLKISGTEIKAL